MLEIPTREQVENYITVDLPVPDPALLVFRDIYVDFCMDILKDIDRMQRKYD